MKGVPGSGVKKKFIRIVHVTLVCTHTVPFNASIAPHSGEPIWCDRCADYKEVV